MYILIWHVVCVWSRLPFFPQNWSTAVVIIWSCANSFHVRLVEITLKDFLRYTDYDVLARKMGLATLLIQRSGLRLLSRNVRFATLMFRL